MSFVQQVEQAAERAAAGGGGPWHVEESDGGVRISCELLALETLACAFDRLEVFRPAWAGRPMAQVKATAEQLSRRLTYLLEPIRPIETDSERCIVQMRSSPPRTDEDRTSYYELLVERSGALSLVRFEKPAGEIRRRVPIHVTREVFRHLLTDFAAAG